MLKYLESENFNEVIGSGLVLVDFYASWCGPCKMLNPVLERLGDDYDIVKVDVDKFGLLAREYGIMSIPSLIVFRDGIVVDTMIGFRSYEDIKDVLDRA
jgi:thioredoxin 1